MKIHPHDMLLEDLLLSLNEGHKDVFFHVTRCILCRTRVHYLPRERSRPRAEALPREIGKERREALGLYVELTGLPAGEVDAALREEPRFHTGALCELLAERSLEMAAGDPAFAEELGLFALRLSEHLDAGRYGEERIQNLRARAWAHVGNACRVRFNLQGAEEAFERAAALLEKGTGEPLGRGIFLDLQASLRRDQRRFSEALGLLRKAVSLFLRSGDKHRAGRSLVKMATVHHEEGQPEESIPLLYQALGFVDPEQEPRLLLCAHHNLIAYLAASGRFVEAGDRYQQARPLYRSFAEPWVQNRRKWAKGKIERGLGNPRRAEALLLAARNGFLAEGVPYDTALVSLELATLYAEEGRTGELKRLAQETLPIFASRQIHREALAAFAFLHQAIEAEKASLELVTRVAGFLRRAQNDPALRFEPPA